LGKKRDLRTEEIRREAGEVVRRSRWGQEGKGPEGILGDRDFIDSIEERSGLEEEPRRRMWEKGWDLNRVLKKAGEVAGVSGQALLGRSKERRASLGRSVACYWLVRELGHRTVDVSRWLGIRPSAVSHCVAKGQFITTERNLALQKPQ
jgi:hypothetical protein